MPNRSRLIKLGTLTFVVGLIVFFPARVAYRWIETPEVIVSGIRGSVWSGEASEASVNGVYLSDMSWRIRPLDVFRGRLGYAVKSRLASGFAAANIAFGQGASIVASDLAVSLPLDALQGIPGLAGKNGNVSANFADLRIEAGLPVIAEGVINVSDLVVAIGGSGSLSLGSFKAEFLTQEMGVLASVEDTDAVIDFAGTLQINSDRSYQLLGLVSATAKTAASVRQQLQYLGSANERGQREIRVEGRL